MKKQATLILIALLISLALTGQQAKVPPKKYKSAERNQYYATDPRSEFNALDRDFVLNFKSDFFEIKQLDNFVPYDSTKFMFPNQDLEIIGKTVTNNNGMFDYERIGNVLKSCIFKYEKKGKKEAFLYQDSKLWTREIWLAYKEKNDWEYYFTGISLQYPYLVKWYSAIPLMIAENKFQIEAASFQKVISTAENGSWKTVNKLIKDGIALVFDLKTLRKDSDHDGFTDIRERSLCTNPYDKDTDKDGIPDNLDLNPCHSTHRSDKTALYENIINGCDSMIIPFNEGAVKQLANSKTETYLIVSDDPGMLNVEPRSKRVIVVTTKELDELRYKFTPLPQVLRISPLFKVDGEENTYLIDWSLKDWGGQYLIKKTKSHWMLQSLHSWNY